MDSDQQARYIIDTVKEFVVTEVARQLKDWEPTQNIKLTVEVAPPPPKGAF